MATWCCTSGMTSDGWRYLPRCLAKEHRRPPWIASEWSPGARSEGSVDNLLAVMSG